MARVARDRILKDANGDMTGHLRHHIHLTNCIHLKNHMHKNSPISTEASFMGDLSVLRRSRLLKDPSASPSSWQSPVTDLISKGRNKDKNVMQNGRNIENGRRKAHSLQVEELPSNKGDVAPSHLQFVGRRSENKPMGEEAETSLCGYRRGLDRAKRRKFRTTRRNQNPKASKDERAQNVMCVASNSFAQSSAHQEQPIEGGEEDFDEQDFTRGSRNEFGMPLNWSSIHDRGRAILKSKTSNSPPLEEDLVDSNSSIKCDAETVPLLVEASGSQQINNNAGWEHDYSGELGICADNLLKSGVDPDVSKARSGYQQGFRRHNNHRHESLTQKYIPRTFREMVGHHLVTQALSNSVANRKVGFVYVFYGPHGTGKTSCARIFARALNCQSMGQTKPCGCCSFCKAYDKGKNRHIREMGPISNFDCQHIIDLPENMTVSHTPFQYKVFIFDDCDTMSTKCWGALSKVIDRSPRHVVFIFVCSSLDVLPHVIISRCQKFLFSKLKDADIVHALQSIAAKEGMDIDNNALKIIASRSDGSLRDAEMTLEQLTLLGQRITVSLVQELVGLISDDKLLDLLDFALSADTVNTVKMLRGIMESGVEPLALMSQLATVVTDILAGGYDLAKESSKRKFFRTQALSRGHMEKLRQALKTLSEAEKQMRISNDRSTWLTAALLHLAPDQQFMLPNSSADGSFNRSPILQSISGPRERPRSCVEHTQAQGNYARDGRHGSSPMLPEQSFSLCTDVSRISGRPLSDIVYKDIEQIWSEVLEKIQLRSLKEFVYQEGKLISLSFGKAPTVQLMFRSQQTKSKAENYMVHLLQAFESVLGSPVRIEVRCEASEDAKAVLAGNDGTQLPQSQLLRPGSRQRSKQASPREAASIKHEDEITQDNTRNLGNVQSVDIEAPSKKSTVTCIPMGSELGDQGPRLSLVKSKATLGQVIQRVEGCVKRNRRSNSRPVSIAERLELENLRLEPRTRSLFCCKVSRGKHRKAYPSKHRKKKPIAVLKFVACGKCLSSVSSR